MAEWKGVVKFEDIYKFVVEGSVEEANVMNEVRGRVKQHGKAWADTEASKGSLWYMHYLTQSTNSNRKWTSISTLTNAVLLRRLIRKGILPLLRPNVWHVASGAATKRSTVPLSYYHDLVLAVHDKVTPATLQIDQDLARTFPTQPWLNSVEGHASLRTLLVAYSFRDSQVGYCQGLNYVAALLLLVMETEEDAFWMLAVLLENVLFIDCYADNLSGCHVKQRVFKELLSKICPKITKHLDNLKFDVSLVTTEWFLCLFAKSLPSETTMRIWDILFNEGANILFRIAIAIFMINEEKLLTAKQIGDVVNILHHFTHHAFDPDMLLKIAFDKISTMTLQSVLRHCKKQEVAVMTELQERIKRLNSLDRSKVTLS